MCNRINMQLTCDKCDYAYRESIMDTDYSVLQIKEPCEICPVIWYLNETLPDSLGG